MDNVQSGCSDFFLCPPSTESAGFRPPTPESSPLRRPRYLSMCATPAFQNASQFSVIGVTGDIAAAQPSETVESLDHVFRRSSPHQLFDIHADPRTQSCSNTRAPENSQRRPAAARFNSRLSDYISACAASPEVHQTAAKDTLVSEAANKTMDDVTGRGPVQATMVPQLCGVDLAAGPQIGMTLLSDAALADADSAHRAVVSNQEISAASSLLLTASLPASFRFWSCRYCDHCNTSNDTACAVCHRQKRAMTLRVPHSLESLFAPDPQGATDGLTAASYTQLHAHVAQRTAAPPIIASPIDPETPEIDAGSPKDAVGSKRSNRQALNAAESRSVAKRPRSSPYLSSSEDNSSTAYGDDTPTERSRTVLSGQTGSCNICSKRFRSHNDLEAHIRTHTGEKPLVCSFAECGKAFAHVSNLKVHERSHTGVKPYPCTFPDCDKAYRHPSSRDDHYASTHLGIRKYKCGDCGQTFTAIANFHRHKRVSHGIKRTAASGEKG